MVNSTSTNWNTVPITTNVTITTGSAVITNVRLVAMYTYRDDPVYQQQLHRALASAEAEFARWP